MTDRIELARSLGIKADEIEDVTEGPAGLVIATTDGATYIDVPADNPDAEGKSGLMFLSAPSDPYSGEFPVFATEADVEADVETAQDGDGAAAGGELDVPDGSVADVLGWVDDSPERAAAALDVEEAKPSPRTTLTDALVAIIDAQG